MYQALYRKWRPQIFDDVIGQKHITDSLKNQVISGHLSHAYLFIGTRGTGKTTCARILAKAVNCENPVDGNPCGKCCSCRGISDGTIMDIVELDAASNNGVDNVRALRDEASFTPADVRKRVYIIDEVHMLSTSAFNALLKIIEEPPKHLMFILATTEIQKVPATILSRCQRHSFKRIEKSELCAYIEKIAKIENISITHNAAELIAGLSEGGVRDSLSMLDQCSSYGAIDLDQVYQAVGLAGNQRIMELFRNICTHNSSGALKLFDLLWRDGKDPVSLLKELSGVVRDILILKLAPDGADGLIYGGYDSGILKEFASDLSDEELLAALNTMQNAMNSMGSKINPKMVAELCIVSLCSSLTGDSISAIRARLSALEKAVAGGTALNPKPEICDYKKNLPSAKTMGMSLEQFEDRESGKNVITQSEAEETYSLQKSSEPDAKQTIEVVPEEIDRNQNDQNLWDKIRSFTGSSLPMATKVFWNNPDNVRGYIDGDLLIVEAKDNLIYLRISKPDVISKIEAAASVVCGRMLKVKINEGFRTHEVCLTENNNCTNEKKTDHLAELRQFNEVKFL